ncbi:hypothetical protein [Nocardioides daeguensis]|uniref:Secreted protein n=1 Tax=Nocardioides daeguensis TaxID=908359 RepID=A0ABP6WLR8_9ACTN|nr:hypothetical protein [Nocardioides daeguensis]MBV6726575.1 hypothetical protein [Nocardioides daeguensis]MCR1772418.1 hypothetical protein [Nocardioides daeguensis]
MQQHLAPRFGIAILVLAATIGPYPPPPHASRPLERDDRRNAMKNGTATAPTSRTAPWMAATCATVRRPPDPGRGTAAPTGWQVTSATTTDTPLQVTS